MARKGDGLQKRGDTWHLVCRIKGVRHKVRIGKRISRTVAGEIAQTKRAEILREHRSRAGEVSEGAPVFTAWKGPRCGERLRSVRTSLDTAARRAKLQGITPHVLRHTFASKLVMAGVDLRTVQELGGWSSLDLVQRYAHLTPEHRREAVQRMIAPKNLTSGFRQQENDPISPCAPVAQQDRAQDS